MACFDVLLAMCTCWLPSLIVAQPMYLVPTTVFTFEATVQLKVSLEVLLNRSSLLWDVRVGIHAYLSGANVNSILDDFAVIGIEDSSGGRIEPPSASNNGVRPELLPSASPSPSARTWPLGPQTASCSPRHANNAINVTLQVSRENATVAEMERATLLLPAAQTALASSLTAIWSGELPDLAVRIVGISALRAPPSASSSPQPQGTVRGGGDPDDAGGGPTAGASKGGAHMPSGAVVAIIVVASVAGAALLVLFARGVSTYNTRPQEGVGASVSLDAAGRPGSAATGVRREEAQRAGLQLATQPGMHDVRGTGSRQSAALRVRRALVHRVEAAHQQRGLPVPSVSVDNEEEKNDEEDPTPRSTPTSAAAAAEAASVEVITAMASPVSGAAAVLAASAFTTAAATGAGAVPALPRSRLRRWEAQETETPTPSAPAATAAPSSSCDPVMMSTAAVALAESAASGVGTVQQPASPSSGVRRHHSSSNNNAGEGGGPEVHTSVISGERVLMSRRYS